MLFIDVEFRLYDEREEKVMPCNLKDPTVMRKGHKRGKGESSHVDSKQRHGLFATFDFTKSA